MQGNYEVRTVRIYENLTKDIKHRVEDNCTLIQYYQK